MDLTQKFGKRIVFERAKRDLTQEQLAEMADLSRTAITSIERAKTSATLETVEKLAKALGYEPHELLIFKNLEI